MGGLKTGLTVVGYSLQASVTMKPLGAMHSLVAGRLVSRYLGQVASADDPVAIHHLVI